MDDQNIMINPQEQTIIDVKNMDIDQALEDKEKVQGGNALKNLQSVLPEKGMSGTDKYLARILICLPKEERASYEEKWYRKSRREKRAIWQTVEKGLRKAGML